MMHIMVDILTYSIIFTGPLPYDGFDIVQPNTISCINYTEYNSSRNEQ